MSRRILQVCLLAFLASGGMGSPLVWAWDPATTHAGLTERALAASKFHFVLSRSFGRPLGALEPLRLFANMSNANAARSLRARLDALDFAGGYRPTKEGLATAGAWVVAGSVLAKTPPERGRNHFIEPQEGRGLDDGPGLFGDVHALRLMFNDGATVRDAATGLAFALEGRSAIAWLWAPENDLGLQAFFENLARSASAPQANDREDALVHSLLALGGVLAVLEDAGQPAFVRNDFRGEFLRFEIGSAFERFVAEHFGRTSLPDAVPAVVRPDLMSYFIGADGAGLAQATQRRFFSAGTIPQDQALYAQTPSSEAVRIANDSLAFPQPALESLDLRLSNRIRYVAMDGVRVLGYEHREGTLHFFLDETVYADTARKWLPEVAGYAAGMIDHLMRAKVDLDVTQKAVKVVLTGIRGKVKENTFVHLYAEEDSGVRKEFGVVRAGMDGGQSVAIPVGARKVAAVAQGRDDAGLFVALGECALP